MFSVCLYGTIEGTKSVTKPISWVDSGAGFTRLNNQSMKNEPKQKTNAFGHRVLLRWNYHTLSGTRSPEGFVLRCVPSDLTSAPRISFRRVFFAFAASLRRLLFGILRGFFWTVFEDSKMLFTNSIDTLATPTIELCRRFVCIANQRFPMYCMNGVYNKFQTFCPRSMIINECPSIVIIRLVFDSVRLLIEFFINVLKCERCVCDHIRFRFHLHLVSLVTWNDI